MSEIDVPELGIDNKPKKKHRKKKKYPDINFVYPDENTGYNYFWNRKLIGSDIKPDNLKVIKGYLERKL